MFRLSYRHFLKLEILGPEVLVKGRMSSVQGGTYEKRLSYVLSPYQNAGDQDVSRSNHHISRKHVRRHARLNHHIGPLPKATCQVM